MNEVKKTNRSMRLSTAGMAIIIQRTFHPCDLLDVLTGNCKAHAESAPKVLTLKAGGIKKKEPMIPLSPAFHNQT